LGISTAERHRSSKANQVWSWDFVEDQSENGTRFRVLTLINEHARECLAAHVAWSIRAVDGITVVEAAMRGTGCPSTCASTMGRNSSPMQSRIVLRAKNVNMIYITPGSPWENPYIESFHDKLRDECLNREIFGSLWEARVVIEQWRLEYNTERPHSSVRYQTPAEFACRADIPLGLRLGFALPPSQRGINNNIKPMADSTYEVSSRWGQVNSFA
jgi:putative transposase